MDFDLEYELENAGIDAFDFSLMDDEERAEALRNAFLDPDDFEGIEFDGSFDAWVALHDCGLSLWDLDLMNEDQRRVALEEAGLDPDDYDTLPIVCSSDDCTQAASDSSAPPQDSEVSPADPAPSLEIYCVYSVVFPESNYRYAYLADGLNFTIGDIVIVPTGHENVPRAAKIISFGIFTAQSAPYPIEKTKSILRKATAAESEPFLPKPVIPPAPSPAAKEEEPSSVPHTVSAPTPPKRDYEWWIIAASAIVIFIIIIFASQPDKSMSAESSFSAYRSPGTAGSSYSSSSLRSSSSSSPKSSSSSSSRSSSSSQSSASVPARPSVNRERAMTKEEAEKLRGTGYHGTRPNSSAEAGELKAAQVKCRNCGYRSHNGLNSLCDYCAWMKEYGGGLPSEKASDTTPKPTPKPTAQPTTKPASDPYNAGSYADPEDFYDDHYDDFWDYEDAEDYWEKYN